MDINSLTIGEARAIAEMLGKQNGASTHPFLGRYVIVRTYSAGVHVGGLRSVAGREVVLDTARRIWQWQGAFTLSEIALNGVASGSKLSAAVPEIALTEAVEIIPASDAAERNLRGMKEYKP